MNYVSLTISLSLFFVSFFFQSFFGCISYYYWCPVVCLFSLNPKIVLFQFGREVRVCEIERVRKNYIYKVMAVVVH